MIEAVAAAGVAPRQHVAAAQPTTGKPLAAAAVLRSRAPAWCYCHTARRVCFLTSACWSHAAAMCCLCAGQVTGVVKGRTNPVKGSNPYAPTTPVLPLGDMYEGQIGQGSGLSAPTGAPPPLWPVIHLPFTQQCA